MKPFLFYLAGYWCITLQFNAFRSAEIKKPNDEHAWYPGRLAPGMRGDNYHLNIIE